jgi:hypothetical protein
MQVPVPAESLQMTEWRSSRFGASLRRPVVRRAHLLFLDGPHDRRQEEESKKMLNIIAVERAIPLPARPGAFRDERRWSALLLYPAECETRGDDTALLGCFRGAQLQ